MKDNDNNDMGDNKQKGEGKRPPLPPLGFGPRPGAGRQMLFWLAVLFLIPAILYYVNRDRKTIVHLDQSQFEEVLKSGLVKKLVLRENSASRNVTIVGQFVVNKVDGNAETTQEIKGFDCMVLYSDALDGLIREYCPSYSSEKSGGWFGTMIMYFLPTILLILFFWFIYSRQMGSQGGVFAFGKSRAKRLDGRESKITMADVAGCEEAKEDMQEIVDYLKNPGKFSRLGGKIPRGVLMVGPPGTGKTLLAKAIAGEAQVPFFSISGSDFVEMFVGVGASRVRDMFEEGKRNAPCLIFIDEIDAVGRSRFSGIGGGHDEREQTLNALLVEMDGFEANSGVIVLAATNRPDVLDPALLRPGRFDRQITVDLPDMKGRLAILKVHSKKTKLADDVDLRTVARGTPGFSGADLANIINEAALLATRNNEDAVTMADLEESRDKVRWGKERRSRRIDDKDRRLTAYHEAGHALVGMLCENATPLHKITIIPRGAAYLGATMSLPEQDRFTMSRKELLDQIAVCFGGRVAEELTFEDITSGASMDIRQATDIAKKMVCQWGMSEKLGPINYAGREEHIFLGRDITRSEDFGPDTAREIDLEIRRIIDEQKDRTVKLLKDNYDKLKLLSETLLERETMMAKEVYELLGMEMPASKRSADDLAADEEETPIVQVKEPEKEPEVEQKEEAPAEEQ